MYDRRHLGRDLLVEAKVFLDGGDPLKRVIDLLSQAGAVVGLPFQFLEIAAD